MTRLLADLVAGAIVVFVRLLTAVRAEWSGCEPLPVQRIYFANHVSHGDFLLAWAVLPPAIRSRTRPVAGADYWRKGPVRRFIAERVFRAVLIDRAVTRHHNNPLPALCAALDQGDSLIIFPEGTRNVSDTALQPFKGGLYHVAARHPSIELVPVWIANLNRVLPKGEVVPIPILCTVTIGAPLKLLDGEKKPDFIARAHSDLIKLADQHCTPV